MQTGGDDGDQDHQEGRDESRARGRRPEGQGRPKAAAAKDDAKDESKDSAKGKKVAAPKSGDKPNALQKPLQPTPELAAIVGDQPDPARRGGEQGVGLHPHPLAPEPENKREILADDKLKKVFGKDKATMFEMNKYLAQHLK